MPALDAARGRLRLLPDDLALLAALLDDPDAADHPRVPALEAAGLLVDGLPVLAARDAVAVVAGAVLVVDVETTTPVADRDPPQLGLRHSVHVASEGALTTEAFPGDPELLLVPVLPAALPWEVARLVGLLDRPAPTHRAPVRVRAAAFDGVAGVVAGLPRPEVATADVRALLAAAHPGTGRDVIDAVTALVVGRRGSWRVTARWRAPAGWTHQDLTVLDGGDAGLWARTLDGDDAVLEPLPAGEVWRRLAALYPRPGSTGD